MYAGSFQWRTIAHLKSANSSWKQKWWILCIPKIFLFDFIISVSLKMFTNFRCTNVEVGEIMIISVCGSCCRWLYSKSKIHCESHQKYSFLWRFWLIFLIHSYHDSRFILFVLWFFYNFYLLYWIANFTVQVFVCFIKMIIKGFYVFYIPNTWIMFKIISALFLQ